MKSCVLSVLTMVTGVVFSASAFALSPPYIALASDQSVSFGGASCTSAAASVLRDQGFARVTSKGPSVFAAYRTGSNYGFKVSVRCMSASSVIVIVVTDQSGVATNKANSILSAIRSQAYTPPAAPAGDGDSSGGGAAPAAPAGDTGGGFDGGFDEGGDDWGGDDW